MHVLKVLLALCVLVSLAGPVSAQETGDKGDFERRMELAEEMQNLRPAKAYVDAAIEQYTMRIPPDQREQYRLALSDVLNYKALEKVSVNAYAETYTVEELEAMVEYFSKPEARSASEKAEQYAGIVFPEIMRMLDRAMIKARTGGDGP